MICPHCAASNRDGSAFCSECGWKLIRPEEYSGKPNPDFVRRRTMEPPTSYREVEREKKSSALSIVLATLGGVIVLAAIVIATVFITMNSVGDKGESAAVQQPATEQTVETTLQEPEAVRPPKTVIPKESTPTENASEVLSDVHYAVSRFLNAYIEDLNSGTYSALYSAVEYGSKMEQEQKKFIKGPLFENLRGYSVVNERKIDRDTYYVTTVEDYDVYNGESGNDYFFQQQCVYIVRRQSNGDWLISGYAQAVKQLEKYEY